MKLLLTVLQFVRMDLEGLYPDLDRAEATLKGCEKGHNGLPCLADHVEDLGSHLHDALAHVNLLEQRRVREMFVQPAPDS